VHLHREERDNQNYGAFPIYDNLFNDKSHLQIDAAVLKIQLSEINVNVNWWAHKTSCRMCKYESISKHSHICLPNFRTGIWKKFTTQLYHWNWKNSVLDDFHVFDLANVEKGPSCSFVSLKNPHPLSKKLHSAVISRNFNIWNRFLTNLQNIAKNVIFVWR